MLNKLATFLFLGIIVISCGVEPSLTQLYESPTLKILKISEHSYQHISYLESQTFGRVACNGLIVADGGEAAIFDTPVNDLVSEELISWVQDELNAQIESVVINHFHVDCLGGLQAFHDHGIQSIANADTRRIAGEDNELVPKGEFTGSMIMEIGSIEIENKFFGAGHTEDNIVSYVKDEQILFGGCMIKSLDASKGNLADADIIAWPQTVREIKKTYPLLKHVIPGHGLAGGVNLLDYTMELFRPSTDDRYIFFLHNRFLETHEVTEVHPQYGKVEYREILRKFKRGGFKVISEKRDSNTIVQDYARDIVTEINNMLTNGIIPNQITVIGTSRGGYIAQYISTYLANPKVNFVFVGAYQDSDIHSFPDINFCGNILNIYEASDPYGVSAKTRKENSNLEIGRFEELELNTGLNHGFLFKANDEWIKPSIDWASQ